MKRKRTRILCLLVSITVLLSLGFAGCGNNQPSSTTESTAGTQASGSTTTPQDEATAKTAEKVKITYWHTYGDAEDPYFKDNIIPLLKEKYPNIELEAVRQDSGQYGQLITTAYATGETPDVARVDIMAVASYANEGGLVALNDMNGFAALKDLVLETPMSTNLFNGKYYGLPLNTSCKAAVVNMTVMKKLGLTEAPKTMEEFIDASAKNSAGKYTLNVSGVGDWDTLPYFFLFGGVLTDPGFTKATGYMDSPQSVAALQKMMDLHKSKILTIRDLDGTQDAWNEILKDGYAMFYEGPWFFSSKPEYKEKNIIPAVIPTYNGKTSSVIGGEDVVIFTASKNQQQAFEFIKFLLDEKTQLSMAKAGQIPVLKSAAASDQIKNDPILNVYMQQLSNSGTRIPSPQNSAIGQIWTDSMTKAFKGEVTAEAALKEAATKTDVELAKKK